MSVFVYQAVYSRELISSFGKNTQNRSQAINVTTEGNWYKLIGCWMAFNEYDLVIIAEIPSVEAMAGAVLAVGTLGKASRCKTTNLLKMDQAVTAMTCAQGVLNSHNPPSIQFPE